jgi:Cyanobacterial TRADD-N associated 2-Transmembrane domain
LCGWLGRYQVPGNDEKTAEAEALCSNIPLSLRISGKIRRSRRMAVAAGLLAVVLLLIAAAATVGGWLLLRSHASGWLVPAAFVTGAFFFIFSVVVPLGILRESGFAAEEKENCRKESWDLLWALGNIEDGVLQRLAWVNFRQLRAFTAIAQRQARMSYYASLAAAAIALLTLAAGAALAIGLSATTGKVAAGVLATVGSVFSAFLVKTFLKSYDMASRQMSYYYGQPLVHCYLLHAQWLASQTSQYSADQEELRLWKKVVDASIKASASAQDHLLSMQEVDTAKRAHDQPRRRKLPRLGQASQQPPMPDTVESLLQAISDSRGIVT